MIFDRWFGWTAIYRRWRGGHWEYALHGAMEWTYTRWHRVSTYSGALDARRYYGGRRVLRCENYTSRKALPCAQAEDDPLTDEEQADVRRLNELLCWNGLDKKGNR